MSPMFDKGGHEYVCYCGFEGPGRGPGQRKKYRPDRRLRHSAGLCHPLYVRPYGEGRLDITHDSATPVGMKVWAESEVTEVDGKRIVLKVAAYDEKGLIGQGTHERFIITDQRFLAKAGRKLEG